MWAGPFFYACHITVKSNEAKVLLDKILFLFAKERKVEETVQVHLSFISHVFILSGN